MKYGRVLLRCFEMLESLSDLLFWDILDKVPARMGFERFYSFERLLLKKGLMINNVAGLSVIVCFTAKMAFHLGSVGLDSCRSITSLQFRHSTLVGCCIPPSPLPRKGSSPRDRRKQANEKGCNYLSGNMLSLSHKFEEIAT